MLNQFIDMVVLAHLNGVSLLSLQQSLTHDGMCTEEIAEVLDIVIIEARYVLRTPKGCHNLSNDVVLPQSDGSGECAITGPLSD